MAAGTYSAAYRKMALATGLLLGAACWFTDQYRCTAAEPSKAGVVVGEIEILGQWTGTESGYRERPRYFVVRTLPELQVFWEKHAPDEPMPSVDFENRMLFLWVSGPSLSGYHVMNAVRVLRKAQGYILELDIRRSDTAGAGSWRNPWLMALLPKLRGDIEVVRRGDAAAGEADRMPLAVIHDMGGDRSVGTAVTKVMSDTDGAKSTSSVPATPAGTSSSASVQKPEGDKPANVTSARVAPAQPAPKPVEAASEKTGAPAAGQAAAGPASATEDPFGDAFNLDF